MTLWDASLLIHVGALFYIAAFLIRDEMILRVLVLAGTGFYILYYFLFPAQPLWDAIITSVILGGANLLVLGQIVLERTTLRLSDNEKALFAEFGSFTPGQFRQVLRLAEWHEVDEPVVLTREGAPLEKLFYLFTGQMDMDKGGRTFTVGDRHFVGEIAYLLDRPPTATATALAGALYVEWDRGALESLCRRKPPIGNALVALLSKDLAEKLVDSFGSRSAKLAATA